MPSPANLQNCKEGTAGAFQLCVNREFSERAFREFVTALRRGVQIRSSSDLSRALDCFEHGHFEDAALALGAYFEDERDCEPYPICGGDW